MEVSIQVHFMVDILKEMAGKLLKMVHFLKDITSKGKKNMGNLYGKIRIVMKEILKKIYLKAKGHIYGETRKCILGTGKREK